MFKYFSKSESQTEKLTELVEVSETIEKSAYQLGSSNFGVRPHC